MDQPNALIGQTLIGGLAKKHGLDRISHYKKYSEFNFASNKVLGPHSPELLAKYFLNYRSNWVDQPKSWSKKLRCNDNGSTRQYYPLSLDIELASICDLACPYCYRQFLITPDRLMKENLAINLIDQAVELSVPSIKFNWRGEPLLHPKIFDLIKYAKQKGIPDVIINTNASTLNKSKTDALLNSGIDYVIFSFDGGTKATYEKNRVGRFTSNLFETVRDNIQYFCRRKSELGLNFPWTRVQMVLTPDAIREQQQFLSLFNAYTDEVVVNNYDERGMGVDLLESHDKEVFLQKIKAFNLEPNAHYMKVQSHDILVSKGRQTCNQPFQRLLITYDGRVSMCCFDWGSRHTVGYVSNDSFSDLDYDKYRVQSLIEDNKQGFQLMKNAKMPNQLYSSAQVVQSVEQIWRDLSISQIRMQQATNTCDAKICSTCTYRGSHTWV